MLKRIIGWIWSQRFALNAEIVKLRDRQGRTYVFRDRPDWFVKQSARLLHLARNTSPEVAPLMQQASEEWSLRLALKHTPSPPRGFGGPT